MPPSPRRHPAWRYGLAALLAIGLVLGLNTLSLRIQPEGAIEARFVASRLERLETGDIRAVNFGGSVGKSLRFSELGIAGVDFSFNGQDLLENEAMMEVVLARARALRQVFLAANPVSMLLDNAWSEPHIRRQYYRILATDRGWRPIGGDWSNLVQGRLLPLARLDRWRGPLAAAFAPWTGAAPPRQATEPPGLAPEAPAGTADSRDRLLRGNSVVTTLLSRIDGTRYFEHRTPKRVEASLVRFCRTVTARGLALVIYAPPVTDLYLRQTAAYEAEAAAFWNAAVRQCVAMGARVLRFDADPTFHQAYRLFDDPVHLNAAGARAFSHALARRLGGVATRPSTVTLRSGT